MPFIYFSWLNILSRMSNKMLNSTGQNKYLYLVPDIKEKSLLCALIFSMVLSVGFFIYGFILLRSWVFFYDGVLDYVKWFFCINWNEHVFLFLHSTVYYIDWFYYEPPLNSVDKFHLAMTYNLFNMLLNLIR